MRMQSLKVGIIGGGVVGTAAAIALQEKGHQVDVYERLPTDLKGRKPLGNGISYGANCARILSDWGFEFDKAQATPINQERVIHGKTLKTLNTLDFTDYKHKTGYDWLEIRHSALLDGLRSIAEQRETINVRQGQKVVAIDCDSGKISLENGKSVEKDVIVVADGLHSQHIDTITQHNTPPLNPGRTAYRFEISKKLILEDELAAPLFRDQATGFTVFLIPEQGIFFICADADEGDIVFGLLMHPIVQGSVEAEKRWDVEGSKQELDRLSEEFHPALRRLCQLATTPMLWTMTARESLKSGTRGRAVAVGDACHPHYPHHGQGATSGIEDAAALAIFLEGASYAAVPARLRDWETFRLPRANTVQTISTNFPAPLSQLEGKIRNEIGYTGVLPENVNSHEPPIQMWLFNYDVRKEAEKWRGTLH